MSRIETLEQLPLETESLLLRRIELDDAGEFLALSNEERFRTWLSNQVYRDESHARSELEYLVSQYASPADPRRGAVVLAIELKAERVLIGHVGFSPFDEDVEIGFAIAERYQGRGFATEAIVDASRWALRAFDLDHIVGITASENVASQRTLVRAKFVHRADKIAMFQGTEQPVNVYELAARSAPKSGA